MRHFNHPLYLFAKPPSDSLASIVALTRRDRSRRPELLHNTLFALGDLATAPAGRLPALIEAVTTFDGLAFLLAFDRIVEGERVTKLVGNRYAGAPVRTFQRRFAAHLGRRGIAAACGPAPHVTLAYRRDGRGDALLPYPIGWRVEEILLVESIVGEGRHVVHARGRLDCHGRPLLLGA
jgi:2'-5' RNA ligase